jgi:hypothetical protein
MTLQLVYLGIKNNPENVSMISRHANDIYYLMSFNPEISFKILMEIAKFSIEIGDNLVSVTSFKVYF